MTVYLPRVSPLKNSTGNGSIPSLFSLIRAEKEAAMRAITESKFVAVFFFSSHAPGLACWNFEPLGELQRCSCLSSQTPTRSTRK